MRRRDFIGLVGAAATWPLVARAQQAELVRRIGVFSYEAENNTDERELRSEFTARLRELGWIEGRNIQFEFRFAGNDDGRMRTHARELVALQPDAIFAGWVVVPALQTVTATIPIVFVGGADPVAAGLVASLARPGGNVTGFSNNVPSIATKRLQVLKQIAPRVTHVVLMYDPGYSSGSLQFLAELEAVAASIGIEVAGAAVRNAEEIEAALAVLASRPGGGLVVYAGGSTFAYLDAIIAGAAMRGVPTIYRDRHSVAAGGLVSYGADGRESYRGAATYVDRILKGEKPADLPVQAPTKYELVINLKTAKALGLDVPPTILARADEVIE
jgi:putative tryptophan/tyrosine transport system substrate-binding protein